MTVERVDLGSLDLTRYIRPGDLVVWGQACAEPLTLTEALANQRKELGGIRCFTGISSSSAVHPDHCDYLAFSSYTAAGAGRDAARVRSLLRIRGVRPSNGGPRSAPAWPELTESEFAVVSLVAQGATNREVADRLYLSAYTVNSHLRHVFAKLGIRSRVELARMAAERGVLAQHG